MAEWRDLTKGTAPRYSRIELHLGPHRLARPRTPLFQGGNAGSNPAGDTTYPLLFPWV